MKLSDGMFHKMFNQIALEYPEIDTNHMIIDIGSAKLADNPEMFDVIVTLNLYGDIISDIAAEVAGSVGLGGSANAGMECAMFEAIHGSAPDIAGKNLANPSGLINGAIMMLCHMGMLEYAEKIQNAWSSTLEQGIHTGDIFSETFTKQKVGTQEFAQAVIENLGNKPNKLKAVEFNKDQKPIQVKNKPLTIAKKELIGVDVFLDWNTGNRNPEELGKLLESIESEQIKLKMITNRGVKVYPAGLPETYCTDHWRCRFISKNTNSTTSISNSAIVELLNKFSAKGLDFIKTENLYTFDGERGYSLGQGE
jgi:isocitrate dehydrogenase